MFQLSSYFEVLLLSLKQMWNTPGPFGMSFAGEHSMSCPQLSGLLNGHNHSFAHKNIQVSLHFACTGSQHISGVQTSCKGCTMAMITVALRRVSDACLELLCALRSVNSTLSPFACVVGHFEIAQHVHQNSSRKEFETIHRGTWGGEGNWGSARQLKSKKRRVCETRGTGVGFRSAARCPSACRQQGGSETGAAWAWGAGGARTHLLPERSPGASRWQGPGLARGEGAPTLSLNPSQRLKKWQGVLIGLSLPHLDPRPRGSWDGVVFSERIGAPVVCFLLWKLVFKNQMHRCAEVKL